MLKTKFIKFTNEYSKFTNEYSEPVLFIGLLLSLILAFIMVCFVTYELFVRPYTCPNCKADITSDMEYCAECGEQLTSVCVCGEKYNLNTSNDYCIKCGAELK